MIFWRISSTRARWPIKQSKKSQVYFSFGYCRVIPNIFYFLFAAIVSSRKQRTLVTPTSEPPGPPQFINVTSKLQLPCPPIFTESLHTFPFEYLLDSTVNMTVCTKIFLPLRARVGIRSFSSSRARWEASAPLPSSKPVGAFRGGYV